MNFFSLNMIITALLVLSASRSATAEDSFFSRKNFGYLSIAAGGWYLKEAFGARSEAGKFNDLYKATDPTDRPNRELYDSKRRRYRTRTKVMLGLSAGSLSYAVYLFRVKEKADLPLPELGEGLIKSGKTRVDLAIDPLERSIQVVFKRSLGS